MGLLLLAASKFAPSSFLAQFIIVWSSGLPEPNQVSCVVSTLNARQSPSTEEKEVETGYMHMHTDEVASRGTALLKSQDPTKNSMKFCTLALSMKEVRCAVVLT